MSIERLEVTNWEAMGLLIKTWATNTDRIKNGKTFLPKPTTVEGFCDMLVDAKATGRQAVDRWLASFGGSMKTVSFVQSTPEHLVVRLPMEQMLLDTEDAISKTPPGVPFAYPLPEIYSSHAFEGRQPRITDAMKFHAMRIGDYTIAQCG
jgi:hypothetical protein